jgi:CHAT domain-containing protein
LKTLHTIVDSTDIVAPTAKATAFYQDLYQLARSSSTDRKERVRQRLDQVVSAYPDFSRQLRVRVNLAYFAIISDNGELADQILNLGGPATGPDEQYDSYIIALRSLIAARHNHFDESIALSRDALDKLISFHNTFENESASYLPTISIPERAVLFTVTGFNASHVETYDNANNLFRFERFLNRDKSKLGLNKKIVQEGQHSDLQREEVRSRDKLRELRDRLMYDAVDALLARVVPIRRASISKDNDYSFLGRLESIEDSIATADEQLRQSTGASAERGVDDRVDLAEMQRVIRPNEALVIHVTALGALLTTCVNSEGWEFKLSIPSLPESQQSTIDTKLLMAAVHGTHEPSPLLDSNFPLENSHRLFKLYLGSISGCLKNKTHILLATDPDLFTLPWNALVTEPPSNDNAHQLRDASWLPKSYAVSLLPSVRSLLQLRATLPRSKARQIFLGVGDPDFKGAPAPAAQLALGRLFASRGVGDSRAISELPRLPDSAVELRAVASALGASAKDLLLQGGATERELRKRTLNDYRVISFATHAIVSGEIDGVTEPALVLSPGYGESDPQNDGLLTAPEIQNLTLDANLVILSACNTAASDGQAGGRGLSGLADAFFFAGARSIAVTQWAVYSKFAQKLGVDMIAQSLKSGSPGVAHGLRQAMTGYLASVTSDYWANPRFWAAFIIAGDGAVGPMDRAADDVASDHGIKIEWEHMTDGGDSNIFRITRSPDDGSFYTLGTTLPLPGAGRAGNYIGKLQPNRTYEIIDRTSDLVTQNITSVGQNIALLGHVVKSSNSSVAQFRMLDSGRKELWRFDESDTNWSFPVTVLKRPRGYALISTETKFDSVDGNAIVINEVSERGVLLARRRYPLSFSGIMTASHIVEDDKGRLIVAIWGNRPPFPSSSTRIRTNPQAGSKRLCLSTMGTVIIALDKKSLDLLERKEIEGAAVAGLQTLDGHLYAASNYTENCVKNIRISAVDDQLTLHSLFESKSVDDFEVYDFVATPDHFILVGSIYSFAPTTVTSNMTLEELRNRRRSDPFGESTQELGEIRQGAFILVVGRDGSPQGDRVFVDARRRFLGRIVQASDDRFIAIGSALWQRGWIVDFSVGGYK